MDRILHHIEAMVNHGFLLVFTGESDHSRVCQVVPNRISSIHSMAIIVQEALQACNGGIAIHACEIRAWKCHHGLFSPFWNFFILDTGFPLVLPRHGLCATASSFHVLEASVPGSKTKTNPGPPPCPKVCLGFGNRWLPFHRSHTHANATQARRHEKHRHDRSEA